MNLAVVAKFQREMGLVVEDFTCQEGPGAHPILQASGGGKIVEHRRGMENHAGNELTRELLEGQAGLNGPAALLNDPYPPLNFRHMFPWRGHIEPWLPRERLNLGAKGGEFAIAVNELYD
jgi:hypothetical protein